MPRICLCILLVAKVSAVIIENKCSYDFMHGSHVMRHDNNITTRRIRHDVQSYSGIVEIFGQGTNRLRCCGINIGEGVIVTTANCLFGTAPARGLYRFGSRIPTVIEHFTIRRHTPAGKSLRKAHLRQEIIPGSAAIPHRHFSVRYLYDGGRDVEYLRNDLAVFMRGNATRNNRFGQITLTSSSPGCPTGKEECYLFLNPKFTQVRLLPCLNQFGRRFSSGCAFHQSVMCIMPYAPITREKYVSGAPVFCRQNKHEKYCLAGILSESISFNASIAIVTRIGDLSVS